LGADLGGAYLKPFSLISGKKDLSISKPTGGKTTARILSKKGAQKGRAQNPFVEPGV